MRKYDVYVWDYDPKRRERVKSHLTVVTAYYISDALRKADEEAWAQGYGEGDYVVVDKYGELTRKG